MKLSNSRNYLALIACIFSLLLSSKVTYGQLSFSIGYSIDSNFKRLTGNVSSSITYAPFFRLNQTTALRPTLDLKLSIFKNGLGSAKIKSFRSKFGLFGNISLGVFLAHEESDIQRYIPLHIGQFTDNLTSNYYYNIGFMKSYIFQKNVKSNHTHFSFMQSVGLFSVSIGQVYISYGNDAGPVLNLIGDGNDRFWTGSLVIGLSYNYDPVQSQFLYSTELLFDEFTGDAQNSFEVTNLLLIDQAIYFDEEQYSYNSSRWSLRQSFNHAADRFKGNSAIALNYWNSKYDLQDWIHHLITNNPYHIKPHKPYWNFTLSQNLYR